MLELFDVFVWVTDPQKYADALLHDEYVQLLSGHSAVTLVVLNQVDRLLSEAPSSASARTCVRLLGETAWRGPGPDDVGGHGRGIWTLRQRLANAVAGHEAARHRLSADLAAVAGAAAPRGRRERGVDGRRRRRPAQSTRCPERPGVPIARRGRRGLPP